MSALRVQAAKREHFRVELRDGRWWLFDLGSEPRTRHDGRPVYDAELAHGDIIDAHGVTLAVWLHDPNDDVHERLEADVLENPDDDERWKVWADWLLERGLELGERINGAARDERSDARLIGALASEWARGRIEIEWWRGFPRKVVVRDPHVHSRWESPAGLLERVLSSRAFRFVVQLELDVGSFGSGLRLAGECERALDVLERMPAPKWLESVRFGPVDAPVDVVTQRWPKIRVVHPQIRTATERALIISTHGSLEVVSAPPGVRVRPAPSKSVGLSPLGQNVVGQLDEAVVQVVPPEGHALSGVALTFEAYEGRWQVMEFGTVLDGRGLRMNGREVSATQLRDGDVLSLEGLVLRFRLR